MPFSGQVRDPIHGYIDYIKELEGTVMDSWAIQRLRYIYQLQAAHLVYPGATHTRFSHSLGVMHLSYKYVTFLLRNAHASVTSADAFKIMRNKCREIVLATRLLGLLHDVGHGPLSHAFDKYVYKSRDFLGYRVGNHEVLGYILYRDFIRDLVKKAMAHNLRVGLDVEYVLELLDSGMKPPPGMKRFTDLTSLGKMSNSDFYEPRGGEGFEHIARMVVRDYIYTSDIMDYLKRDSYFTGVPIGEINEDWIIRNSFILEKGGKLTIAIASKALDEIARLFDARKLMYKYIYVHPVDVAFVETIGFLLNCIKSFIAGVLDEMLSSAEKLHEYISLTDHSVYSKLQELLVRGVEAYECEDKALAKMALESLFYQRKPMWKLVKRFTYDLEEARVLFGEIGEKVQEFIKDRVCREISSKLSGKGVSEGDIKVSIEKVEAFPTAGSEIVDRVEIVDVKDGRVVHYESKSFEEFAAEYGLKSEALISVYLNRRKYRDLSDDDIKAIIELTENIVESSIRGKGREPPETS